MKVTIWKRTQFRKVNAFNQRHLQEPSEFYLKICI